MPDRSILQRLITLLGHPNPIVKRLTMKTIMSVVRFDPGQIDLLLDSRLVPTLSVLLREEDPYLRGDAVDLLRAITGINGRIQAVIDAQLVPDLLEMLSHDTETRFKVVKIIKYMTLGRLDQVGYLVEKCNVLPTLFDSLQHFKVYDDVLIKMYGYTGPTYNFEFAHDILWAIGNILHVGELDAEEKHTGVNRAAILVTSENLQMFGQVLAALNAADQGVNSWRKQKVDDLTIEQKVNFLLLRIQKSFAARDGPRSPMALLIDSILSEHRYNTQFSATTHFTLKSNHHNDVRVEYDLPVSIKLATLTSKLEFKYGLEPVVLRFVDQEGDALQIDSDQVLAAAIQRSGGTLKGKANSVQLWSSRAPQQRRNRSRPPAQPGQPPRRRQTHRPQPSCRLLPLTDRRLFARTWTNCEVWRFARCSSTSRLRHTSQRWS